MTDLAFVEKLAREWSESAREAYRKSDSKDVFRLGELRGRFDYIESFANYIHDLSKLSKKDFDIVKRL